MWQRLGLVALVACADPPAQPEQQAQPEELALETAYEVPRGQEKWLCLRTTLTEDVTIVAVAPKPAPGVHHSLLALEENPSRPDGLETCRPELDAHRVLFAAGKATDRLDLPGGIGLKAAAGTQLLVHLHLFNAGEAALAGNAGFVLSTTDAAVTEAGLMFAGKTDLDIPPGESTQEGRCTIKQQVTLFAVAPHMHGMGTSMRVAVDRAGTEQMLIDEPYDLDGQPYFGVGTTLGVGDVVRVACRYDNDTDEVIHFGGSGNAEMCYARLLFYPRGTQPMVCTR